MAGKVLSKKSGIHICETTFNPLKRMMTFDRCSMGKSTVEDLLFYKINKRMEKRNKETIEQKIQN